MASRSIDGGPNHKGQVITPITVMTITLIIWWISTITAIPYIINTLDTLDTLDTLTYRGHVLTFRQISARDFSSYDTHLR